MLRVLSDCDSPYKNDSLYNHNRHVSCLTATVLVKMTVLQMFAKSAIVHGTRTSITVLTTTGHRYLSSSPSSQSII